MLKSYQSNLWPFNISEKGGIMLSLQKNFKLDTELEDTTFQKGDLIVVHKDRNIVTISRPRENDIMAYIFINGERKATLDEDLLRALHRLAKRQGLRFISVSKSEYTHKYELI